MIETHHCAASGDVVLTDRTDTITFKRYRTSFWVRGTFRVQDGRIVLWDDAFGWGNFLKGSMLGLGHLLPGRRTARNKGFREKVRTQCPGRGCATPKPSACLFEHTFHRRSGRSSGHRGSSAAGGRGALWQWASVLVGPGARSRSTSSAGPARTRDAASGTRVTITADWGFVSHHDLAAERVAAAFGGFTSCLGVADRVVPALRETVLLLGREGRAPITAVSGRGWMVAAPVAGCVCMRRFFRGPAEAARHARDLRHLARRYDADVRALEVLATEATRAHDGFAAPP